MNKPAFSIPQKPVRCADLCGRRFIYHYLNRQHDNAACFFFLKEIFGGYYA